MNKPVTPPTATEEVINEAVTQYRAFLEKEFNGKRIRVTNTISIGTKGVEITFSKHPHEGKTRIFPCEKDEQVTKQTHLQLIAEQQFSSIRKPELAAVGRSIIQRIITSTISTITAAEIVEIFHANGLTLWGKSKQDFSYDLQKINQVLIREYGCRIIRYNHAEFGKSPNRHFALFKLSKKTTITEATER